MTGGIAMDQLAGSLLTSTIARRREFSLIIIGKNFIQVVLIVFFSCLAKGCHHKLKVLFNAVDESIKIEVDSAGHDEEAHSNGTLLTPEIKAEIQKWASTFKPNAIRLKLLVSI